VPQCTAGTAIAVSSECYAHGFTRVVLRSHATCAVIGTLRCSLDRVGAGSNASTSELAWMSSCGHSPASSSGGRAHVVSRVRERDETARRCSSRRPRTPLDDLSSLD
jgi:hypothetical protein